MIIQRPRRLRANQLIRNMVAETHLSKDMFMYPYFVIPGTSHKNTISSLPGLHHFSVDELVKDVEIGLKLGINKLLLFGVPEEKSEDAHTAYDDSSVVVKALKALKSAYGSDIYLATDICTCAYMTHGHCGVLYDGVVQNDASLEILSKIALAHAAAGADMVAPSDMMDGRIGAMRNVLDASQFQDTALMAYSIKFASAYYGPFREAAGSAPQQGDRKSYQMDFRNRKESMREAYLDEQQGADIIMVKPALAYLDIISDLSASTKLPVACYNVSGEYAMVKLAAKAGLINESALVMENMYAFARAGANLIITYHVRDMLENNWL